MTTQIQKKRKKLGLSQVELAGVLGISRPTLIKVEKGERKLTTKEKERFDKIARSFELDKKKQSDMRVSIPQENVKKFKQVLLYVLEKVGAKPNVGMTVLYKLLYFIDFDYYEKYEKQLMGLTYIKNDHGPTPRQFKKVVDEMRASGDVVEVKSKFFTREQKKFLPRSEANFAELSGEELEMINDVLDRYSDRTATQLSEMTHRDMPWKATEYGENIDYELAFYRPNEFSVRDYSKL
ncbi:MAG: type II toxin-antitoxin system antitoxin SocA domain-containing protein [Patescibacteria group bacterium]